MSGLQIWLLGLRAVVDQVHEPAALVELEDGSLVVVERRCLPPDVREGQPLRYRPGGGRCPLLFAGARVDAPPLPPIPPLHLRPRASKRAEP